MSWTETNRLDCGCVENIERNVADKVIKTDMRHCVAHCLEWAGSFLTQAGRRMLEDAAPDLSEFSAVYKDAETGTRLWVEDRYLHPKIMGPGEVYVHEGNTYGIVSSRVDGKRITFKVKKLSKEEAGAALTDMVVDHLKKLGMKEPKSDEADS